MIAGAIRVAFSRATSTSKTIRLTMDFGDNTTPSAIWLEEGDQPHVVQSKDKSGTGGAAAETEQEKQAIEESGRIVAGPTAPRTYFKEIDAMGLAASAPGKGHKALERGIKFPRGPDQHDDAGGDQTRPRISLFLARRADGARIDSAPRR